ncbi:hypothetical protein FACS1894205_1820 [Alphaproteobacteria bacterium]|nr:hypothetical protein FACS1894205_1820 [Alphaproteobacteria bacterium]
MSLEMIERNHCVLTGADDLEPLYQFRNFPVFMGCTDQSPDQDVLADMNWFISRETGCIQLNPLLPQDLVYQSSHGSGSVGALWRKHHRALAEFIHRFQPRAVLEIGGGHGRLPTEYRRLGAIPWTILEPNPTPVEGCPATFRQGFFDENFPAQAAVDTVVHSHVFEHMYEPDIFVQNLAKFMKRGDKMIFSLPTLQVFLTRGYTICLNFEHTALITEPYVEYLLKKHGFRVLEKQYFMEDHSIFYATEFNKELKSDNRSGFINLYETNKQLYNQYIDLHKRLILEINSNIAKTKNHIYLFGGHATSQFLLSFGLDPRYIQRILDNDVKKHGLRLYGTNLYVESPLCLKNIENPIVILRSGVFNEEIKQDILNNINSTVQFLE